MRNVVQSPQSTCHLRNNREVVDASGAVTQVTNYYPFGAPYADASASKGADVQPYKYNGKELDLMHGLNTYDYGARQHDPILGRWDRIDPLCEKYYSTSPYAYCMNNPVRFIDSDGKQVRYRDENDNDYVYYKGRFHKIHYDKDGNFLYMEDKAAKPSNEFMRQVLGALNKMRNSKNSAVREVFSKLTDMNTKSTHTIFEDHEGRSESVPSNGSKHSQIFINLEHSNEHGGNIPYTMYSVLGHEMKHSYDRLMGISSHTNFPGKEWTYTEFSCVYFENILRDKEGISRRYSYGGVSIRDKRIPELYKQAMLWKDWINAPKEQRR